MLKKQLHITEKYISEICMKYNLEPVTIQRFLVGQGNFVFYVETADDAYVVRCGTKSYHKTVRLLKRLSDLEIHVSIPLHSGKYKGIYFMLCSYIKGEDLGKVYHTLSDSDKKEIAKEVVAIQRKVAKVRVGGQQNWTSQIQSLLHRAKKRISANGYFDTQKVDAIEMLMPYFRQYFSNLRTVAYLDDISTKNLLIHNKRVSGIIDVDWLGYGDSLSFIALTYMALLDMQCDTVYVQYLLDEMDVTGAEYRVFLFYTLLYCVDFMGERGMTFCGKKVEVNTEIIQKLNGIYENLFSELQAALESL